MSRYRGLEGVTVTDGEVQFLGPKALTVLDSLPLWKGSPPEGAAAGDLLVRRDNDGHPTGIVKLRQQGKNLSGENYALVCPTLPPKAKAEDAPKAKKKKSKKAKAPGKKKKSKKKK